MILIPDTRRKFLARLAVFSLAGPSLAYCAASPFGQQDSSQTPPSPTSTQNPGNKPMTDPEDKPGEPNAPFGSRKLALEENEKDIKKKIQKLFRLATELKDEVEKTDSVNVLSVAMLKKADEIERLAKEIRTRARG
jgi:hypothetical protein